MVLIIDEKDEVHELKGSWNCFPVGKIRKLVLMNGDSVVDSLEGFSKYVVEWEAVSIIGGSGHRAPKVTKETIYGVHDISLAESELLTLFTKKLDSINKTHTKYEEAKLAMAQCRKSYDSLLEELKSKQVVYKSFPIDFGVTHLKFNENSLKHGTGKPVALVDILGFDVQKKL